MHIKELIFVLLNFIIFPLAVYLGARYLEYERAAKSCIVYMAIAVTQWILWPILNALKFDLITTLLLQGPFSHAYCCHYNYFLNSLVGFFRPIYVFIFLWCYAFVVFNRFWHRGVLLIAYGILSVWWAFWFYLCHLD